MTQKISSWIYFFILIVLFSLPLITTHAQEPNLDLIPQQLQQKIKELEQQISNLQKQLETAKTAAAQIGGISKFTKTLQRGITGDEVKELQEFLKQFLDIYPEGLVTGYFGPLTEAAVKRLQEKSNIEAVGVVGPKTRAKLNELVISGTGSSGTVPPGLTTVPGVQEGITTIAVGATTTPIVVTATPSGGVPATPATPAEPATPPSGANVGSAIPAIPATPATPAQTVPPPDTTAPVISNVQATNLAETSVTITWTTDELANGKIDYSLFSPLRFATSTPNSAYTNNHSFNLSELSANTVYYYQLISSDASGNTATSSEQSFTTLTPPPPPPPPVGSSLGPWITFLSITPTSGPPGMVITFTVTAEDQNGIESIGNNIKYPGTNYTLRPNWNLGGATRGTQTFSQSIDLGMSPTKLGEYVITSIRAVDSLGNISTYYPNGVVENSNGSTHNLIIPSIFIQ